MKHFLSICLVFLVGCSVGPDYKSPETIVSDEWQKAPDAADPFSNDTPAVVWWKVFGDPILERMIESAASCNQDILKATSAICQARALRQIAASKLFPQVTADFSAIKTYFSKNGPVFSLSPSGGQNISNVGSPSTTTGLPFSLQIPQIQNLFTFLFDASWEIDLFGKTRRAIESADAQIDSAIEDLHDTLLSVIAEVARNYMELRSFQKRSQLVEKNIHLLKQMNVIVQAQVQAGYANQLDLDQMSAQLAAARSALPDIHAEIYRSIYSLSLLTGQFPEALVDDLLLIQSLPQVPDIIAIGLRSDLLKRRPDVRRAERELASATADIGVAVASFYPTFTLLGDGGLQSLQFKKFFQSASRTWAYGSDLNMPVFQGGKLIGNLRATEARCCIAGYQYQQAVLSALEDAERSLISYSEDLISTKEWRVRAELIQHSASLMDARLATGFSSLLQKLTSDQQVISSELDLLDSETATLLDLIALYKALGGGWDL